MADIYNYRCHGELSRSCDPNICDNFNQLCLAQGKITPTVRLCHEAKRSLVYGLGWIQAKI